MKKTLLLIFWLAGLVIRAVWAQTQIFQLEGKVITSSNEPLVGAIVEAQKNGATISGTYTNPDGEFVLGVADTANLYLKVSYLGYKTYLQRVSTENYNAPINITMIEDYIRMDDIVVVGYGTQEKRNVTGSVSGISNKEFENISAASVDQVLQGRAAGVQVYQNSGTPGGGISVRIRGFSSITSGNTPFYVVDGVPINTGDQGGVSGSLGGQRMDALSSINPNDIESIEILKDASAAAIYGARASNGVVLITTKRGSAGKAKFNFNMYAGYQEVWKKPDLLSAKEFMELRNEAARNDSARFARTAAFGRVIPAPLFPKPTDSINTRWMDEILRTALIQNYQLSVSGGTDKARYYISGTYFAQDGIQKGTSFERFNPRVNLDILPFSKFTLGVNMNMVFERRTRTANDNNIYGPVGGALLTPAFSPVKNPDGTWFINDLGSNPIGVIETDDNFAINYRGIGNAFAKYEIIRGLFVQTSFGIDLNTLNERYYNSPLITGVGTSGSILQFNSLTIRLINENVVTYKR
ncbi:MAG: SusC/RagA family TonB-linked outer membrane protein, partial [Bacteroidia bacterium]|nr:SusC/RagA family TonB-linked outer membrane protein [Bacteroidia bacterium]